MSHPDAEKWNKIYSEDGQRGLEPVRVLTEYAHLLPVHGDALDLACGTGANALLLAQQGLDTSAWDISAEAIQQLRNRADELGIEVITAVRDVVAQPPAPESCNVIVVSHFLDRTFIPALILALKPDGLLFYQTFIREKIDASGPCNPDYRLAPNELLQLCRDLHILVYREEGLAGDTTKGFRNEAMLVGQRR